MRTLPATRDPCRYMVDGACTNRLALPVYGARPSEGVCGQCEHRNGLRGLGDAIAWILSFTPARKLHEAGCKGCKERQEALNSVTVTPRRAGCGGCKKK